MTKHFLSLILLSTFAQAGLIGIMGEHIDYRVNRFRAERVEKARALKLTVAGFSKMLTEFSEKHPNISFTVKPKENASLNSLFKNKINMRHEGWGAEDKKFLPSDNFSEYAEIVIRDKNKVIDSFHLAIPSRLNSSIDHLEPKSGGCSIFVPQTETVNDVSVLVFREHSRFKTYFVTSNNGNSIDGIAIVSPFILHGSVTHYDKVSFSVGSGNVIEEEVKREGREMHKVVMDQIDSDAELRRKNSNAMWTGISGNPKYSQYFMFLE